ncbi:putative juvenile hormone acid methyltransferase [Trypoxylus dichotomus]
MSYGNLWTKTTVTKHIASFYLQKFGHLLKWKDYKEIVMEVGCAEGSVTKDILFPYIKNHMQKLVAIDKLNEMINCAKEGNVPKEIDFVVMDIMDKESVKKKLNQFDHIFSTLIAHWIPDNRSYLSNLYHMLKFGGQIFHTQLTNKQVVRSSFEKQFQEGKWTKYVPNEPVFADYTNEPVKYVQNLFCEVGFNVQFCQMKEEISIIENFGDFIRPLLHIYQHLDRIPNEKREDFFQYHINNCREICIYKGEPDVYEMHYQTIICVASKAHKKRFQ